MDPKTSSLNSVADPLIFSFFFSTPLGKQNYPRIYYMFGFIQLECSGKISRTFGSSSVGSESPIIAKASINDSSFIEYIESSGYFCGSLVMQNDSEVA